jgi:hypothetical protein
MKDNREIKMEKKDGMDMRTASVAVALFLLFLLPACSGKGGKVTVTESEKGRTHTFTYMSDGTRTILDGSFSIDGKLYPGMLLYDGKYSYVVRKDPDQCIRFGIPDKVLFGFMPWDGKEGNVTVLEKDAKGRIITYQVEREGALSTVTIEMMESALEAGKAMEFTTPADCVNDEEAYTIG